MRYTISKPQHGTPAWLAIRWQNEHGVARISASVAGAVHNEHPFKSAADLANELLAIHPPEPVAPNKAMERGNRLEPVMIEWVADIENIQLHTPEVMYAYDEPAVRLIATLDAIDENGDVYEVKTSKTRWTGVLPRYWYWQGIQQAICADVDKIEWVIFDGEMELKRHTQIVTSDERQMHIDACREFLSAIDTGNYPANCTVEYRHVAADHPESQDITMMLPDEFKEVLSELAETKKIIKELEEREETLKTTVCAALGDAQYGAIDGSVVCTWKTSRRNSLDSKALEAAHPALVAKFRKETSYRTFNIKGAK